MKLTINRISFLIISIAVFCIIVLCFYLYQIKNINTMKAYERGYKFDYYNPQRLDYYISNKLPIFQTVNQMKILIEINNLLKSLEHDRMVNLENTPKEYIDIYFDGDASEFFDLERFDYLDTEDKLTRFKDEINNGTLKKETDVNYMLFQELFVRRYCLFDFNTSWYMTKRIIFSYNFLAYALPGFSQVLYSEDYISNDINFKRENIITPISAKDNTVESLIERADQSYIYIADTGFIKKTLVELKINENKKNTQNLKNEFSNTENLFNKTIRGEVLFVLYK